MSTVAQGSGLNERSPKFLTSPDKYVSIGTLLDDYAKPDARDLLVERFGDQGITGFLKLTGATNNVGTSDEVYYFEEGRRHKIIDTTGKTITNGATKTITVDMGSAGDDKVVAPNDLVMDVISGDVFLVTDTASLGQIGGAATALSAGQFVIETLDDSAPARTLSAGDKLAIVGNMHAQGSAEPGSFYEPDVERHTQTFAIVKNKYEVNGSQATNIG